MKRIFLFLSISLMIFSCAENTSDEIVFSTHEIKSEDFASCKENECPKIKVNYLLAEGEKEISKNINEMTEQSRSKIVSATEEKPLPGSFDEALKNFIAEYQNFKKEYPEFPGNYELQISEKIIHRSAETIVTETKYYIYTGGAHGYGATNFATFSLKNGTLLKPQDLFSDLKGFTGYAEKKFREKFEIPSGENINATGFFFENDVFSLPNNIAILENEVVLIYNPYEAAAYARGQMELRFPKEEIKQWLKQ